MKHFIHFATNIQPVNMAQSIHRRSEFKVIHLQHHASTIVHSPFLKLEADYKVQGNAFVPKHPTSGLSNPAPGGTPSCTLNLTPEAANQGFTRHTRNFQAGVLRQVGAKLCRTVALQDRVWTSLTSDKYDWIYQNLLSGVLPHVRELQNPTVTLRKVKVQVDLAALFLQSVISEILYSRFFLSSITLEEMQFTDRHFTAGISINTPSMTTSQ